MGGSGRDLDAVMGRVAAELLVRSHNLPPGAIAGLFTEVAAPLGVSGVRVYLADLQQQNLRLMPAGSSPGAPEVLPVGSTAAGRAYRQTRAQHSPAGRSGLRQLWLPLLDGSERLGVLELAVHDAAEDGLDRYQMLASLAGLMIASKSIYSDSYAKAMRTREMALQAELVWAFTASRTFATDRVLVAAALEPAYEVGGDAFDYSLLGDRLHVSVFDAVGHDLTSGLLTSVAMAASRSTRRAGRTLSETAARADHAIGQQFGDHRFVTALLCELNLATGQFTWIPCGHPPPLLFRGGMPVTELARPPQLPLGLADLAADEANPVAGPSSGLAIPVYTVQLQPGDRLLLHTDGVTEGRDPGGTTFGDQRLRDFILSHDRSGVPAPEILRRLTHALSDYQHGHLSDDATMVLLHWLPSHSETGHAR